MTVGLVVEIIGDASKLASELDKTEGKVGGLGSKIGGSGVKIAAFAGVVGVAAVGMLALADAAAADRDEAAKLETVIKAAGAAHGDYAVQVEAAIAAGQEKAFTDSQTRAALESLVVATGDVTAATGLLGTAQDVARFAGVDLATAADAVAKAQAGSDGALRKLMPGLAKGATAMDTLALATDTAAGSADTYATSSQGMKDKGADAFSELGETIGSVFLPILDELMPAILPILKAFGELVKALLPALVPLVKLLAKALGIAADVLKTVVTWLSKLVGWLGDAIGAVGHFLDSINPFRNISLPSLPFLSSAASVASAAPAGRARAGGSSGVGGVTVNVSGDPAVIQAAIVRALRTYDRRNAPLRAV
jgi:phage-related protein